MDINTLLSNLLGGLDMSNTAVTAMQPEAAATTAGISGAAGNMETYAQNAIASSQLAAQQAAEIERKKAALGESAQIVAGLNPDDLNNEYVRTMANLTATRDQREAEFAKYQELTSTGFLDNPIGYIFNQLELPQVVQRHNNLATRQDALSNDLAVRTQLMYQNKTQVTANVASEMKEQQLTTAAAQTAAAQAKYEAMRMENFGKISTAKMNELALTDKLTQNASTKFGAGMQIAQFNVMQQERADNRIERAEARAARAADKADRDKVKAEQVAQETALGVGLARVSGALGYPMPITIEDFKKMPASKAKQEIYNAAIEGTFGNDLSSSIKFLASGNLPKMQQSDPAFIKGVQNIASGIKSYAYKESRKLGNEKMKPEEAEKAGAAEYTMAVGLSAHDPKAAAPLNDATWDTLFNPYRSQDITMLAKIKKGDIPQLANNSYVKVLETVAGTLPPGTGEFRGQDKTAAIQSLAELVRTRTITPQQAAADLVAYTNIAAVENQRTFKLATLTLPVQESAFVRIPGTFPMSGAVVGDTMNLASAENLLVNLAVSRARSLSNIPGFGGIESVARKELLSMTPDK